MSDKMALPLPDRLRGLASFLPEFESPVFEFGKWSEPASSEHGVLTWPFFILSETATAFVQRAYDLGWVRGDFDWVNWKDTSEARELHDSPASLAQATPDQLAHLLTVVIRQDRFVEGSLELAYQSGLLTGILRRAEALVSVRRRD